MNFTDTHCHLADPALKNRLPAILRQAEQQGVRRFIVPATQRGDWADVIGLWHDFPDFRPSEQGGLYAPKNAVSMQERPSESPIYIGLGVHPWFAEAAQDEDFAELSRLLRQYPQAWVGEIGLDFAKAADEAQKQRQTEIFSRQLQLAQNLQRRVIVHNVKATAAIAAAVKACGFTQGGMIHAFSGSVEESRVLVKLGFKIGIGSLLLNPNAKKVRLAAQQLDLKDMVLETDSPFMLHGEINTPANVRRIAEMVADLRGMEVAELAALTEKNIESLLHFQ